MPPVPALHSLTLAQLRDCAAVAAGSEADDGTDRTACINAIVSSLIARGDLSCEEMLFAAGVLTHEERE